MRDLSANPAWQEEDLGMPLPDTTHACSVCLPTWDAVVGYEEGREKVIRRLRTGYPRFFKHPIVERLFDNTRTELASDGEDILILPTKLSAQRAHRWLERLAETAIRSTSFGGFQVLIFPEKAKKLADHYWRFSGEIVSSRQAQDSLHGDIREGNKSHLLSRAVAKLNGGDPENCFIFSSGISAALSALRSLPGIRDGKKTLQIEFPYVDSLKIQERFGNGVVYLNEASGESFDEALQRIRAGEFAGVFTEIPSNPLLRTLDLKRVSESCRFSRTPLVLDDSSVGPLNVDVLPLADILTSSLTKWVSGAGDVMAGALTINTNSPHANDLRNSIAEDAADCAPLYIADAEVLLSNIKGYAKRNTSINKSALALVEFLKEHPAIDKVWHPSVTETANYDAIKRKNGGYGGLISISLTAPKKAPKVYDSLRLSKGPSFGTPFTLVCPYTLLAHYDELKWTEDCGVPTNLIRISVGLEPTETIIKAFEDALS
ncbi:MAG: PLP-dependent transferase [Akkermansiaceae bacterium]|nr:PLP-dependent transferase [Akkermansiaceae bacterium]MDP4646521.1 PLP-dependent transferase [Akkermansiaceae bacterium]MDP4720482.1 PLP-dependent transferase [Akkermansiaceae bacterium]MDP4779318.1 PLP-dependent transferase [Akkermansiaceae bacterium]MDP4846482.1 PLP-dependent transferase [Akkermansiaceae bacterium]